MTTKNRSFTPSDRMNHAGVPTGALIRDLKEGRRVLSSLRGIGSTSIAPLLSASFERLKGARLDSSKE